MLDRGYMEIFKKRVVTDRPQSDQTYVCMIRLYALCKNEWMDVGYLGVPTLEPRAKTRCKDPVMEEPNDTWGILVYTELTCLDLCSQSVQ